MNVWSHPVATISRCFTWVLVASAFTTAWGEEPKLAAPEAEETWQVIYLSGQRVGYARVFVHPVTSDDTTLVRTESETHLTIQRFGQTLKMSSSLTTDESLAGDLHKFSFDLKNPPASTTTTTGAVSNGRLRLTTTVDGRKTLSVADWNAGVKSPTYQDRLLRAQPLEPGRAQEFETFFPEMGKTGTLKVVAGDKEEVALQDGTKATLQKLTVTNTLLPGVPTIVWVDEQGHSVKSSTAMLGTDMVTYTVPKEKALESLTVAELDLGISTLVKTKPIARPYATQRVVYRITLPGADPSNVIPKGDSQQVTPVSEHVAEVTVTALPLTTPSRVGDVADEFLKPTGYLQSDDERVIAHARAAAGALTDPAAIAEAMEIYVHKKLTQKNFSTALASAGEVARTLEGDCTEHAVLLAAMLRVKQIPSRVAVGLVYVEGPSAFGGHMWTEANLNGKWVPLDATLGRGGIGGTHIKLGDATFVDDQGAPLGAFTSLINVIGKLQIDVVQVEPGK